MIKTCWGTNIFLWNERMEISVSKQKLYKISRQAEVLKSQAIEQPIPFRKKLKKV